MATETSSSIALYYSRGSYYCEKVLFVLLEKKLKFQHCKVNLQGEQYEPWFMNLNPKGQVPILKDGEKIICESTVICNYLEENYSDEHHPSLLPEKDSGNTEKEKSLRQLLETFPAQPISFGCIKFPELTINMQMSSVEREARSKIFSIIGDAIKKSIDIHPEFKTNYLEKITYTEAFSQKIRDKSSVLQALEDTEKMLLLMEEQLATHSTENAEWWLCSKNFTLADVLLSITLKRLQFLGLQERYFARDKNPNLQYYYARVQKRPSFELVFS